MKNIGQTFYHTAKGGHPIYVQKLSFLNLEYIKQHTSDEVRIFVYVLHEKMIKMLFPLCSNFEGKKVDKVVGIVDLKNTSLFSLFTKVFSFISNQ